MTGKKNIGPVCLSCDPELFLAYKLFLIKKLYGLRDFGVETQCIDCHTGYSFYEVAQFFHQYSWRVTYPCPSCSKRLYPFVTINRGEGDDYPESCSLRLMSRKKLIEWFVGHRGLQMLAHSIADNHPRTFFSALIFFGSIRSAYQ